MLVGGVWDSGSVSFCAPGGILVGIGVIFGAKKIKLQLTVTQKITPAARQTVTDRLTNVRFCIFNGLTIGSDHSGVLGSADRQ